MVIICGAERGIMGNMCVDYESLLEASLIELKINPVIKAHAERITLTAHLFTYLFVCLFPDQEKCFPFI